jgi:hypothetical protein
MAAVSDLSDFATTERQREVCALVGVMSYAQIGKKLGIDKAAAHRHYAAVKKKAALQGWSPEHDMTKMCPETHYVKGTSTLYDADGVQKLQWVKTTADQDRLKIFSEELATSICQSVKPAKRSKQPKVTVKDKLAVYPIGDAHIGLYCWDEDAGEDYDLKIATQLMTNGFDQVLAATPAADQALIVNLGDWFHTDTTENLTRRSGHHLDVDTRWAKVTRVGVTIMRYLIDRALEKHKKVHVINEIGNHDDQTSIMLSMVIEGYYSRDPRLTVDTSPDVFHWYEFGQNLIGIHHGHQCKPEALYRVMCEDKAEAWGRCKHRRWLTGHVHHDTRKDIGSQKIESFRTLIPGDNYAHGAGYRSPRDICSIVFNRDHGECARTTVNVEALR